MVGSQESGEAKTMTTGEAAALLGINAQTIRDAIAAGYIRAKRVVPPGWSPLRAVFLLNESDVLHYQKEHLGVRSGGGNLRVSEDERAEMESRGFLTIKDAAILVGVTPQAFLKTVKNAKLPIEQRSVMWIARTHALSIKKDRDRKIARLGLQVAGGDGK